MKALRLEATHRLAVRDVPLPAIGSSDLLVRVEASGICGTDRHLFHGTFPCTPPMTLGHEFCGIVEQAGADVPDLQPGARVTVDPNIACGRCGHCVAGRVNLCLNLRAIGVHRDGGLAEYVSVPYRQAFTLPTSLDPAKGALSEPLACCLHGLDLANIGPGASVVVLGGGVIGLLVVQLCRMAGATTIVLSTRQAAKRQLAEQLGATATIDPGEDFLARMCGPHGLVPGGADVVIECAGVADTMRQATMVAARGGTVVLLGVMSQGATIPLEPFDLLFRELKIVGSFLNPFTHRRAADLIASGAIATDPLISRRVGLEEAAAIISAQPEPGEVKVLVDPSQP
jgi:L-iditol 2-dehydrogenase